MLDSDGKHTTYGVIHEPRPGQHILVIESVIQHEHEWIKTRAAATLDAVLALIADYDPTWA